MYRSANFGNLTKVLEPCSLRTLESYKFQEPVPGSGFRIRFATAGCCFPGMREKHRDQNLPGPSQRFECRCWRTKLAGPQVPATRKGTTTKLLESQEFSGPAEPIGTMSRFPEQSGCSDQPGSCPKAHMRPPTATIQNPIRCFGTTLIVGISLL